MGTSHTVQRIVVPVAPGYPDDPALSVAAALAGRLQASVEAVTVIDPRVESMDDAEAQLDDGTQTIACEIIESASIVDRLIDITRGAGTLMCLRSSAHTALFEAIGGSVSDNLFHRANVPLVFVGPKSRPGLHGLILAIAVDGSREGERVLTPALALAEDLGLTPMIYQVLPPDSDRPADSNESAYVHNLARSVSVPGRTVGYDVLHDHHPAHALARLSESADISMIAMATNARSAAQRLIAPSTTHHLLQHAYCPVFTVPHVAPVVQPVKVRSGRRVVAGIEGSELDHLVIAAAVEQAVARDAAVELVHGWIPTVYFADGGMAVAADVEQERNSALNRLERAVAEAKALNNTIRVTGELHERTPADSILAVADGALVVVVGGHRHHPLGRWLLGSTADAVTHRCAVPTLVVPEPRPAPPAEQDRPSDTLHGRMVFGTTSLSGHRG